MDTNALAPGSETICVLIVEPRLALREGLRMRLTAETDLAVAAQVPDCESAFELLASACPDIVLVDAEGPVDWTAPDGALRLLCLKRAVVVLSLYDDAISLARAENAGASAFVAKSASSDALLATIRQVCGTRRANRKGGNGKTPA